MAETAFTPFRLAGLWSGAKSLQAIKASSTSLFSNTDSLKRSPPCTIRWPTALISSNDLIAPYSGLTNVFRMNSIPAVCSGMSFSNIFFSPLGKVSFRKEPTKPIFSIPPCARTSLVVISNNLYLIEELPQLSTNIFMMLLFFGEWLFVFFSGNCLIGSNGNHLINIVDRATAWQVIHRTSDTLQDRADSGSVSQTFY